MNQNNTPEWKPKVYVLKSNQDDLVSGTCFVREEDALAFIETLLTRHTAQIRSEIEGKKQEELDEPHAMDNQRGNLRVCTHRQNTQNCRKRSNSTSRYRGYFHPE